MAFAVVGTSAESTQAASEPDPIIQDTDFYQEISHINNYGILTTSEAINENPIQTREATGYHYVYSSIKEHKVSKTYLRTQTETKTTYSTVVTATAQTEDGLGSVSVTLPHSKIAVSTKVKVYRQTSYVTATRKQYYNGTGALFATASVKSKNFSYEIKIPQ